MVLSSNSAQVAHAFQSTPGFQSFCVTNRNVTRNVSFSNAYKLSTRNRAPTLHVPLIGKTCPSLMSSGFSAEDITPSKRRLGQFLAKRPPVRFYGSVGWCPFAFPLNTRPKGDSPGHSVPVCIPRQEVWGFAGCGFILWFRFSRFLGGTYFRFSTWPRKPRII